MEADDDPGAPWTFPHLAVSHGIGWNRHLRATCGGCGRRVRFDPTELCRRKLAGQRLSDVGERLKCAECGHVGARLEIYNGPAVPDLPEDVKAVHGWWKHNDPFWKG